MISQLGGQAPPRELELVREVGEVGKVGEVSEVGGVGEVTVGDVCRRHSY